MVKTLRLSVTSQAALAAGGDPPGDLEIAASILREGGTVAFATETVYGLGANALDADAVAKIFVAKQRPAWDPLIVHIVEGMLTRVVSSIPEPARVLMDRFWPGPLTLLMPRHPDLPEAVTAGRPRAAVRMPAHPVAQALIRSAGVPIAAPSANTFGHVSPTTAEHVANDLDGRIDAILDSGETLHGLESTVIDACADPCILYRPGAIAIEQLRAVWPAIEAYGDAMAGGQDSTPAKLVSPGQGMRHYAPRARLVLVEAGDLDDGLRQAVIEAGAAGESVGLMLPGGLNAGCEASALASAVFAWGNWSDTAGLAQQLFAGLRWLDRQGVQVVVCPVPRAEGIGVAIGDRLRKAARRL